MTISRVELRPANGRSEILVGEPLSGFARVFGKHAKSGAKVAIVADAAVGPRYGKVLLEGLKSAGYAAEMWTIPSGERTKNIQQTQKLYHLLAKGKFERGSWLIALGGGVAGDLTGFVAA